MVSFKDYTKKAVRNTVKDDVNSWIANKREVISLDNSALFKARDIGFVDEVVAFLAEGNLTPQLKGGAKHHAQNGNPGQYMDIDLLVSLQGENRENVNTQVMKLINASQGLDQINDWEVEKDPSQNLKYVGTGVDYRFKLTSPKTGTVIDLNFGTDYGIDTIIRKVRESGYFIDLNSTMNPFRGR
ncbi:hypothetical protein HOD75_02930 [archaeon]|jgi:hypothetical protein|nr:hypothetical protein [Candidatus Woesearchaeota archaeon]MBT4135619.1 hypothetical protein [archaeon]MBT4241828.1 hypothetical protein [archaeon]MBT4418376.1 hypothetical protein [archaeon]